jgi:hypothetical protein
MVIHPKSTITWIEERVIHVLCYRPGLAKKSRKAGVPGTLGLRDGRLFFPSPVAPVETTGVAAPESASARPEETAEIRPAGPPPPPPLAPAAATSPA